MPTTNSENQNMQPAPRKKGYQRKLTPFLCQEMLYDYVTGQLDPDRHAAVDEFVKTDRECQEMLEAIRSGLEYSLRLAATQIEPVTFEHMKESENALSLGRRYSSWSSWPEVLRWSITAVGISAVVAVTVALVPWGKFNFLSRGPQDSIEIARIPVSSDQQMKNLRDANENSESSGDGEIDSEETPVAANPAGKNIAQNSGSAPPPLESGHERAEEEHDDSLSEVPPEPPPQQIAKTTQETIKSTKPKMSDIVIADQPTRGNLRDLQKATNDASAVAEPASPPVAVEKKEAKPQGFVYRAFMNLPNLDEVAPKITSLVREQGAEKAGEVELGWKRGNGRYYHFTLPAENEEKVLEQLRAYGPVRISKDPHPRVMPQGQVRFILWVEAAN